MVRMFIRHAVNDFDTWKQTYDEFDETRKQIVNSDRLAETMEEAGVAEEPTIWFTEPA